MKFSSLTKILFLSVFLLTSAASWALPELTEKNISVADPKIKIWGVKAIGSPREGSTTGSEDVTFQHSDGSTSNGSLKVQRGTIYQDGEINHNYGSRCYHATTKYWITPSTMSMWKFYIPSNNQPIDCPSGISPTGDADIRKAESKEQIRMRAEAERAKFRAKHGQ